jgi:hypothetical protein
VGLCLCDSLVLDIRNNVLTRRLLALLNCLYLEHGFSVARLSCKAQIVWKTPCVITDPCVRSMQVGEDDILITDVVNHSY